MIYTDIHSPETMNKFNEIMLSDDNFFMSRIGGTEFTLCNEYYNNPFKIITNYTRYFNELACQTGYFDCTDDKANNLKLFIEKHTQSYINAKHITYANYDLIKSLNAGVISGKFEKFLQHTCKNKILINYTFIEGMHLFLESFKVWGKGKKILIVSPFSKSIAIQYEKRNSLFKNGYVFPEFELKTYNTKITYSLITDTKKDLNVTTNNWHEEMQSVIEDVSKIDFDIALLSCASYSGHLGNHISEVMKKKAIYFGGTLNVMWNIYGGRYNNGYVNSIVNLDTQIDAVENADIIHLKAGKHSESEALNAYFGKRTK